MERWRVGNGERKEVYDDMNYRNLDFYSGLRWEEL